MNSRARSQYNRPVKVIRTPSRGPSRKLVTAEFKEEQDKRVAAHEQRIQAELNRLGWNGTQR